MRLRVRHVWVWMCEIGEGDCGEWGTGSTEQDALTHYATHIERDHYGWELDGAEAHYPDSGEGEMPPTVAEMGGAFEGGPDSVEWLRDQRGATPGEGE